MVYEPLKSTGGIQCFSFLFRITEITELAKNLPTGSVISVNYHIPNQQTFISPRYFLRVR